MFNEHLELGDNYKLDELKRGDCSRFVNPHYSGLFKKSSFNNIYLKLRFVFLLKCSETISVVIRDCKSNNIVGLVYGGKEGYKTKMNHVIMLKMLIYGSIKPWILLSSPFLCKLKKTKSQNQHNSNLRSGELDNISKHVPKSPTLRLSGIVLDASFRRLGFATILVEEFVNIGCSKNFSSIVVKTPLGHSGAITLYKKNDFKLYKNNGTDSSSANLYSEYE
jgi:ribosomal protein S18 acetylase RimI-like enzyme